MAELDFTTELCEGAGRQQGDIKIFTGNDYLGSECDYLGVVSPDGSVSHRLVTRTGTGEEFLLLDTETGQGLEGVAVEQRPAHVRRLVGGVATVNRAAA